MSPKIYLLIQAMLMTISSSSSVDTSQLTAQLTNLQKQFAAEAKSKDDAKTKETKEAALQNEIAMIASEIAMVKQQKLQTSSSSLSSQLRVNEQQAQEQSASGEKVGLNRLSTLA